MRVAIFGVVLATLAASGVRAEAPSGSFETPLSAATVRVYDLSGPLDVTFEFEDAFLKIVLDVSANVTQTAKGRLRGTATAVDGEGSDVEGFLTCEIDGRLHGRKSRSRLRFDLKCNGTLSFFGNQPAKLRLRSDVRLDHKRSETRTRQRLRGKIGGQSLSFQNDTIEPGTDGFPASGTTVTVGLGLGVDPVGGKRVTGIARAHVPTPLAERVLDFVAVGRYDAKRDRSKVILRSVERGSRLKLRDVVIEDGQIVSGRAFYKLMGQRGWAMLGP